MKFGRTGLAVLGLFAVAAIGCPQPTHKKNGGIDETGGDGGDGGDATGGKGTGGKANTMTGTGGASDTGGSMSTGGSSNTGGSTSTGGSSNTGGSTSTGGASGGKDSGAPDTGGGMGGSGGGGADMAAFMTLYDTLIKPKCGPGCHITGSNGNLMMPNAMAAYTNLVNKMASNTTCKMLRVKPGDPTMSVLSKKVSGATCGTRMPAGGKPALTAAEIQMIDDWIKGP